MALLIFFTKKAASKLAPIGVVMLPEAFAFEALLAAFERKAGWVFLRGSNVSLQKIGEQFLSKKNSFFDAQTFQVKFNFIKHPILLNFG